MFNTQRLPTMQSSLCVLIDKGVEISCILDVGILTGTGPLIRTFPHLTHHLFEPVNIHNEVIRANYSNITHKIYNVALSDSKGSVYLACWSIHQNNKITHSQIVDHMVTEVEIPGLISCEKIHRDCLDDVIKSEDISQNCLLKIDVDGHEMSVLRGANKTLDLASIVVIEAPLNRVELPFFFERSNFLLEKGFYLMDIVDLAYYDGVLWQADLVFVKKDIVNSTPQLRPFESKQFNFSSEKWYPISDRLYPGK